jgi:hypothetical protein
MQHHHKQIRNDVGIWLHIQIIINSIPSCFAYGLKFILPIEDEITTFHNWNEGF